MPILISCTYLLLVGSCNVILQNATLSVSCAFYFVNIQLEKGGFIQDVMTVHIYQLKGKSRGPLILKSVRDIIFFIKLKLS